MLGFCNLFRYKFIRGVGVSVPFALSLMVIIR